MINLKNFPFFQIFIIGLLRFVEPVAFCSIFPYIYRYLKYLGIPNSSISIYAGYLSSIFPLTQFFFSVPIGYLSDRYGCKPLVLFGLFGTGVSLIIFGLSTNFILAFITRMVMGGVNSNVAILRTMLGQLVKDRNQQALAFLVMPLLYNVGAIIGPIIGGSAFLVPNEKDLENYSELVQSHPFILPNLVVAIFIFASIIFAWLFLEETNPNSTYHDYGVELGNFIKSKIFNVSNDIKLEEQSEPLIPETSESVIYESAIYEAIDDTEQDDDADDESINSNVGPLSTDIVNTIRRYSTHSSIPEIVSHTSMFTPAVIQVIVANLILFFHCTIQSEFFPVILALPQNPESLQFPFTISGGFGLESNQIGNILAVNGISGIAILMVFPLLDNKFNGTTIFQVSIMPYPIIFFLIPLITFTIPAYSGYSPVTPVILLYAISIIYEVFVCISIPQIALLIHRVAPVKHKGLINSMALSISSLARSLGPIIWGYLMSYFDSINLGGGTWYILSGICTLAIIQSFYLIDHEE